MMCSAVRESSNNNLEEGYTLLTVRKQQEIGWGQWVRATFNKTGYRQQQSESGPVMQPKAQICTHARWRRDTPVQQPRPHQ